MINFGPVSTVNRSAPKNMETKLISHGRRGIYEFQRKKFYSGSEGFRIEPWSGIYYVFHGLCLPLIFEKVIAEYQSHRVRTNMWNKERVTRIWDETGDLWQPVIDWVNEKNFENYIGFSFNKYRIEWYWNTQFGESKELNKIRVEGLQERFEELGNHLKNKLAEQRLAADA
jgi:hypothetical protein